MKNLRNILSQEGLLSTRATPRRNASSMSIEDYYNPDDEDANWGSSADPSFIITGRVGPESSEEELMRELRSRHSNRAYQVDRSGRRAPGKPSTHQRWAGNPRIVSPEAEQVLETLKRIGPAEIESSVGDNVEFSLKTGPQGRALITGSINDGVFKFRMSMTSYVHGEIDVSDEIEVQREGAHEIKRLLK